MRRRPRSRWTEAADAPGKRYERGITQYICVYMCIYMHLYLYACAVVLDLVRLEKKMHLRKYFEGGGNIYTNTYKYMYMYMCKCIYVYICIYMNIYACIYIYAPSCSILLDWCSRCTWKTLPGKDAEGGGGRGGSTRYI